MKPGARAGLRRALLLGVLFAAAVAPSFAEDVRELTARVRSPEEPRPRPLASYRIDGVDYLRLNDVAQLFRSTKYWRAELEKMVLKAGERRVRVTVGSPFVFVDDDGYQLVAPARWLDGDIVVPVDFATEVMDGVVPESVSWDRDRRVLHLDTGEPNVLAVAYDVRSNGTVAEISLAVPLGGELEFPRPDRVELRIPGGVLQHRLIGEHSAVGLLESVTAAQQPGYASLTFRLGPAGGAAELLTRGSPPRLLVAVSEALGSDDIPLPDFERRAADGEGPRDVRVVVLDPGHGGSDPGVTSASGLAEKEITLGIARKAKEQLERLEGMEVHLTRTGDRFLSAEKRAELANSVHPDVVVSIHCNGWFDSNLRGFSVGVPRAGEPSVDPELPRWGTRTPRSRRDTETLAEILLQRMGEVLPIPSRGVRTAPFAMIEATRSPVVHIECGFLTNRSDASYLVDPDFQTTVANAIVDGIGEYRRVLAGGEGGR